MNRMEHLEENVATFSPLDPCTEQENKLLAQIADQMSGYPTIPCTTCEYCMPCPYGVNIPANFAYYNEAVNSHLLPLPERTAADYGECRQLLLDGYRKASEGFAVCKPVATIGRFVENGVVRLHDERTRCGSDLPLA
jgi:predicted aldo/keto reductase-like oxidoreductase